MSKLGEWSEKDALPQVRGARSNTRAKTGMSKADLLRRYRDHLDMCRKWRKDEKHDDTWRRMIDLGR